MRGSESHDREFFRAMEMHLEASRLLLDASRDAATTRNHMAIYHAGYAVECALKARFLRTQKPSQQGRVIANVFKKRVKHDLDELKLILGEEQVFLTPHMTQRLQVVKSHWTAEMRYRPKLVEHTDALDVFRGSRRDCPMGGEVSMARRANKKQDERTAAIYEALATQFPELDSRPKEVVYVYNPVAIRVRVVDESFAGQSYSQRHRRVMKALEPLPEEIVGDITMVLALTPSELEKQQSLVNLEFDDPSLSRM